MSAPMRRAVLALLVSAAVLPACAAPADAVFCKGTLQGEFWQRTELYFGRNSPAGEVTETQFQGFLDGVVTPLFPDGLTVLDANGQYRASPGSPVEKERTKLLILLYPFSADASAKVEQIRTSYKQQFQQQSVLRTDVRACVGF